MSVIVKELVEKTTKNSAILTMRSYRRDDWSNRIINSLGLCYFWKPAI